MIQTDEDNEFDKMKSLGDTATSFACYVRSIKK